VRRVVAESVGIPEGPYDCYVMENDDDWLRFRLEGIGGSDVSSIMGINKYGSPLEVWLEKTGRKQHDDMSGNEAVEWGNRLESMVREKFAEMHPELFVTAVGCTLVARGREWAHANMDGAVRGDDGWGVLEIKTVGASRASDWDDGVPDYYLAQVTHYLSVTGWKYAWVAALIGGQHYVEFKVVRDEEDVETVEGVVDTFWLEYVKADVMPAIVGTKSESKALFDMYGSSDGVATPENLAHFDSLVEGYRNAKAMEKSYKERADRYANELRAAVGGMKSAVSDVWRVTWVKGTQTKFDAKRFRAEHPDLAPEYDITNPVDRGLRASESKR
jgi:putative phage-type endonuclease